MKPPSHDDQLVDVTAYMTDEHFGYDHWRATQFRAGMSQPVSDIQAPALLVVCKDDRERDALRRVVADALAPETVVRAEAAAEYDNYLAILRRDVRAILKGALNEPITAQTRATLAELVDALGREA